MSVRVFFSFMSTPLACTLDTADVLAISGAAGLR
jgi:hypothetical protein